MKSYDYYRKMGYTNRERTVPPDSGMLGRTIADIEKEYRIVFDHIHYGKIDVKTKAEPNPDYKLAAEDGIHVWGRISDIARFFRDLSSRAD